MKIKDLYSLRFDQNATMTSDFEMVYAGDGLFVGKDVDGNTAVIIESLTPQTGSIGRKTKLLKLECNIPLQFSVLGQQHTGIVHILRCFSQSQKERLIFLELVEMVVNNAGHSQQDLIEAFQILSAFFEDTTEPSDIELMGFYAELYTIIEYHDALSLEKYWQSRSKLKFDFSFSDLLKLEVKSTSKTTRIHHFKHDQLATNLYNIYVLSYLLRYDDEGLSLYDLITACKDIIDAGSPQLITINRILKNTSEERLKAFKYDKKYTDANRHFYDGLTIPQFKQINPQGVTNAEYDCDLENINYIPDEDFITIVKNELNNQ